MMVSALFQLLAFHAAWVRRLDREPSLSGFLWACGCLLDAVAWIVLLVQRQLAGGVALHAVWACLCWFLGGNRPVSHRGMQ